MVGLVVSSLAELGCGGALYAMRESEASEAVTHAEQLDAPAMAPYEYYFALEHLRKARSEAAEGDYGDAERLATTARDQARRAAALARASVSSSAAPGER